MYKEISAITQEVNETIDSVLLTCNEPQCGLSENDIVAARELDSSSSYIFEFFNERPLIASAIITVTALGISALVYVLKNAKRWS